MGTSPILCDNGGMLAQRIRTADPSPFPFIGVGWGASELALRPAVSGESAGRAGSAAVSHRSCGRAVSENEGPVDPQRQGALEGRASEPPRLAPCRSSECHLCRASPDQGDRVKTRGFEVLEWSTSEEAGRSARGPAQLVHAQSTNPARDGLKGVSGKATNPLHTTPRRSRLHPSEPRGGSSPLIRIAVCGLRSAQSVPIRLVIDVERGSELVVSPLNQRK